MRIVRDVCSLCNSRCMRSNHYPRHVLLACQRKVDFATLDEAIDVALHIQHKRGGRLHVYLCPLGEHWHHTSTVWSPRPQSDLVHISTVLDGMFP